MSEQLLARLQATHPEAAAIARRHLADVADHAPLARDVEAAVVTGALVALGARRAVADVVASALHDGVAPAVVVEVLYQAAPYAGLGRALDAVDVVDEVLAAHGVDLPLPAAGTTTDDDRAEVGFAVQRQVAGAERVDAMRAGAPPDEQHIQASLAAHCFGDHLTRNVLDLPTRELLTLAMLTALGGADPQLASHVAANVRVGNDRALLIAVITRLLPWVGYPRTLNALRAVDEQAPRETA